MPRTTEGQWSWPLPRSAAWKGGVARAVGCRDAMRPQRLPGPAAAGRTRRSLDEPHLVVRPPPWCRSVFHYRCARCGTKAVKLCPRGDAPTIHTGRSPGCGVEVWRHRLLAVEVRLGARGRHGRGGFVWRAAAPRGLPLSASPRQIIRTGDPGCGGLTRSRSYRSPDDGRLRSLEPGPEYIGRGWGNAIIGRDGSTDEVPEAYAAGGAIVATGRMDDGSDAIGVWHIDQRGGPTGAWIEPQSRVLGNREAARRLLRCVEPRAITAIERVAVGEIVGKLTVAADLDVALSWWEPQVFSAFDAVSDVVRRRREVDCTLAVRRQAGRSAAPVCMDS